MAELWSLFVWYLLVPGVVFGAAIAVAKSGRSGRNDWRNWRWWFCLPIDQVATPVVEPKPDRPNGRRWWVLGFFVALVVGWLTRWDVRVTQYQGMPLVVRVNRWTGYSEMSRGVYWVPITRPQEK